MNPSLLKGIILLVGYAGGFIVSSICLRLTLHFIDRSINYRINLHDIAIWIGICEYFLTVTFVLLGKYTAIGLIFTAKSYVRSDKIKEKPSYYLLGTLFSLCNAVLYGLIIKFSLGMIS